MKLKLAQIIGAQDALKRLAGEKYPANIAYRIQRNMRVLEREATDYHKTRDDLIKNKYGVEIDAREKPGAYKIPQEKTADFKAELELLLNEEMDLNIMVIPLDALHEISPLDLMALEWMFDTPASVAAAEEQPAGTYRESHRVRQRINK